MKPKVWGKHFWYTIHMAAMGYPENPTFEDKMAYKEFYQSIGKVLPCKKCTLNYARHFADMNIDAHMHSRQQLFNWTVYFHNTVNKELGKPQWNTEYALSFYNSLCEKTAASKEPTTTVDPKNVSKTMVIINIIAIIIGLLLLLKKKGI